MKINKNHLPFWCEPFLQLIQQVFGVFTQHMPNIQSTQLMQQTKKATKYKKKAGEFPRKVLQMLRKRMDT